MIGRAGVLSSGIGKKNLEKSRLRAYYEEVSQNPQKIIYHSKYPFAIWFIGLFCVVIGIVMIWHIAFNIEQTLFSGFRRGTWWQYLISIGITLLGVLFIIAGKKSYMEMNRETDVVMLSKTNICCRKKKVIRKMSECINVQIIRKGLISPTSNTSHYKLMLYFLHGSPVSIYESGDELKVKKKYVDVVNYLGLEINLDNVMIVDHTINVRTRDRDTELDRV